LAARRTSADPVTHVEDGIRDVLVEVLVPALLDRYVVLAVPEAMLNCWATGATRHAWAMLSNPQKGRSLPKAAMKQCTKRAFAALWHESYTESQILGKQGSTAFAQKAPQGRHRGRRGLYGLPPISLRFGGGYRGRCEHSARILTNQRRGSGYSGQDITSRNSQKVAPTLSRTSCRVSSAAIVFSLATQTRCFACTKVPNVL
jgi:hypothetical protein